MSEFSKGNWVARGTDVFLDNAGKFLGHKLCRAQVMLAYEVRIKKSEAEANARLIAAAPRMFEILSEIENASKMNRDDFHAFCDQVTNRRVSEVLNKVRGES